MKNRNELQEEITSTAITALETNHRATIKVGTGVGKGKIMLDVLAHFNPDKITWLVDSQDGRDRTDPEEFIKWGYEYLLEKTTFACYDTARTWKGKDLGFLIGNEADYSMTDVRKGVYLNNKADKIFLATATISEEKQELFDLIAPVVYELTTQDAQDMGILNKTKFIFIDYLLSEEKNVLMKTKTKQWYTSEQEQYTYWDNQWTANLIAYLGYKKRIEDHYANPNNVGYWPEYAGLKSKRNAAAAKMKYARNQRANILYNLTTSREIAKGKIREILDIDSNNKVIVFSNFTTQIDAICKYTHHSNNNHPEYLDKLDNGDIRCVGVVGKINRGKNLKGVNHFVFIDYDGSATKGSQRTGRATRLNKDDEATLWILRPYFKKKVKVKTEEGIKEEVKIYPTRAVGWAESMLSDFSINESNSEIIKLF